jgi:hypothetical protein
MGGGTTLGGGVHDVGALNGYPENWMASTQKTIEDELRSRGIAPETTNEITSKPPSRVVPVLIAIAAIALICAIMFVAS